MTDETRVFSRAKARYQNGVESARSARPARPQPQSGGMKLDQGVSPGCRRKMIPSRAGGGIGVSRGAGAPGERRRRSLSERRWRVLIGESLKNAVC